MKTIIKALIKFFGRLFTFISKHKRATLFTGAFLGSAGAAVGYDNAVKAKKIINSASEIQKAAIDKHDQALAVTQKKLSKLGEIEKEVIDSFEHLADVIEQIQGRPKFKHTEYSEVKLPKFEPEEIKTFSIEIRMAVEGLGGAGAGALAGMAAFGIGAIMAAPALVSGGLVLCVKGVSLKRKAIESMRQAKEMEKSVNEIVEFYSKLGEAADSFRDSLFNVYRAYLAGLQHVENTLTEKDTWKKFTREEKRNVENTIMMFSLLRTMVQTEIVIKPENPEKLEKVNTAKLLRLQKQADKLVGLPA